MRKIILAPAIVIFICFLSFYCKKSGNSNSGSGSTDPNAMVTPVGTPVGSPVSQSIDANGGTIVSADGVLHIIIPAGALSSATTISIQPVTNEFPDGVYNGYSLTPDGQKFQKPITLEFHYRDADLDTLDAGGLSVAYQSPDKTWEIFEDPTLDTVNKTVSTSTDHFTPYVAAVDNKLIPNQTTVQTGNGTTVAHQGQYKVSTKVGISTVIAWSWRDYGYVNTNDKWEVSPKGAGTITPTGDGNAYYKAPDNTPSPNIVTISKTFTQPGSTKTKKISAKIKIEGPLQYRLDAIYTDDHAMAGTTYQDSSSVTIAIKRDSSVLAQGTDITNNAPTVTEDGYYFTGTSCLVTFQQDGVGTVNITKVTGTFQSFGNDDNLLTLDVYNDGCIGPTWKWTCAGGSSSLFHSGGKASYIDPVSFEVSLKNPKVLTNQKAFNTADKYYRLTPLPR
jgi:hypothetical protein